MNADQVYKCRSRLVARVKSCLKEINTRAIIQDNKVTSQSLIFSQLLWPILDHSVMYLSWCKALYSRFLLRRLIEHSEYYFAQATDKKRVVLISVMGLDAHILPHITKQAI